jgi:aryl-alcohol dehydrogenase-like predicted oxidoreductase
MTRRRMDRRSFLQAAGAAAVGVAASAATACARPAQEEDESSLKLPRRPLGRTGERLSIVGFGGIVVKDQPQESANELVAQAIERDINYFDVAPAYGNAEERLGPALEPYRDQVFLACKTERRDRAGAESELRRSLERLRTDHFDLYQFHAVTKMAEVDRILGEGGAMEAFLAAREEGLIRYIGFSAHSEQAALALLDRFEFDTVLYPINWVCWHAGNFGPAVVAKAEEQGAGILGLKALALQQRQSGKTVEWPKCWYEPAADPGQAALGLRFTLSRPVTAAVSPSHAELLWWACDAAERLTPLSEQEEAQLALRSADLQPLFRA